MALVTTPVGNGDLLVEGPTYGSYAYVAIYNTTFPAPPGVDPGWLLSRADYGVSGHTPIALFDAEEDAKSAEYGLNADLGWSDKAAYVIVASSMRAGGVD